MIERSKARQGERSVTAPADSFMQASMTVRIRRIGRKIAPVLLDRGALVATLLIAAVFTGLNILQFPHYESDEGTYMGSAWAMYEQGKLSYYTYNYDHPPFGWSQIGAWASLLGGFMAFGTSVNTGRVLMLIVAVLSALFIFLIVRRATGRPAAALFAAVAFVVAPLSVSLHRQVWLDNIATLWLLVSLYALVAARGRMGHVVLSALTFGLAFWTKEVFVVFLPGMLYLAFVESHPMHRRFAVVLWGVVALSGVSFFVLLALLKDELLPPGVLWSSSEPHVSMIETLAYQASRGGADGLLNTGGEFHTFFGQWRAGAPLLVTGGLVASGVGLLLWRRDRLLFGVSVLAIVFLLFLGRGGVVLYYYVVPLLALFAIVLGLLAGRVAGALAGRWKLLRGPTTLLLLVLSLAMVQGGAQANTDSFTMDSTSSQKTAARWIADNLPSSSTIVMDAYPWADLREPDFTGGEPFWNAHYYFPAVSDPSIRDGVLKNDWRNIDYLAVSPSTEADIARGSLPLVTQAAANADEVQDFSSGDWRVRILRIRKLQQLEAPADPLLARTWEGYEERFVSGGRVVDPQTGTTTSEGQGYALLRAVYMDDREAFDEVWGWTKENLQVREGDALLSREYGRTDAGTMAVLDKGSAANADTDAALALLFASRQWEDPQYEDEARNMIRGIWEKDTTLAGDRRIVAAGSWARSDGGEPVMVNASYLAPYAYRIFGEVDPEHPWEDLIDSSYGLFDQAAVSSNPGNGTGLAPDWLAVDPATGAFLPTDGPELGTEEPTYDANRVPWRISLDYLWFKDDRARETLESLSFPRREIEREGLLFASYNPDGSPMVAREAISTYAGVLPGLLFGGDRNLAHRVFAEKIMSEYKYDPDKGAYWGKDPHDYQTQNMAWFATSVMNGSMSNLWAGDRVIDWQKAFPEEG